MTNGIVPFGKYRGQPLEVLQSDQGYCEWLAAQPWFREKYQSLHLTIINAAPEPQNTPEHNQMQARLLDDDLVLHLTSFAHQGDRKFSTGRPIVTNRLFEDRGWDCTVELNWQFGESDASKLTGALGYGPFIAGWTGKFLFECKPQIGDDYPAVVRQVDSRFKRDECRDCCDSATIVVWTNKFQASIPIEEVRKLFPRIKWVVCP